MIKSKTNRSVSALALSAVLFLSLVGIQSSGAIAQSNNSSGPIKLYKGGGKKSTQPAPVQKDKTVTRPKAKLNKEKASQIAVQSLGKVDLSSVGSLLPNDGGFPADMWKNSRRELLEAMIPQLPTRPATAQLRSLQRRLLLSAAEVPKGRKQGPSLLALRAEKLRESGWLEDAVALLAQVPEGMIDPTLARAERDSMLLSGDVNGACQVVGRYAAEDPSMDWQKSSAFCAAIEGDGPKLELLSGLLQDQGLDDPAFFNLLNEIQFGEKTKLKNFSTLR